LTPPPAPNSNPPKALQQAVLAGITYTSGQLFTVGQEAVRLNPYVPQDKNGNAVGSSGITIRVGYDTGQHKAAQFITDLWQSGIALTEINAYKNAAAVKTTPQNKKQAISYLMKNSAALQSFFIQQTARLSDCLR
jgi:hypothetical protein